MFLFYRDNVVDSSFYAGVFVESGARPNIVSNTFHGGDDGSVKNTVTQVNKDKSERPTSRNKTELKLIDD